MTQKGTEIWKILTPEQRAEFKKLNEERRERWKRFQE
jgi:Spy/CpxP family protein refolding chaperone